MDREKPALPKMQLNFIDYLVLPLFGSMKEILPKSQPLYDRLEENKSMWRQILQSES